MSAGLKVAGVVAGAILLAVVAAAGYFAFFFDANACKPRVIAAVQQYSGRALAIDGDVTLVLLPSPHATLRQLRLARAEGFGEPAFAEIDAVVIDLRPWPLLRRRVEITEIVLERPRLHLQRDRSGKSNWADLRQKRSLHRSAAGVVIHSLRIQDGELSFDDQATNRQLIVSRLNLRAGDLGAATSATIEARADVLGERPKFKGTVALSSQGVIHREAGRYDLDALWLRFQGQAVAALPFEFALEAKGHGAHAPLRFDGRLTVAEFSPQQLLARMGKTVPAMRDRSALTRARLAIDVAGDPARLVLSTRGQLDDSMLKGHVTVQRWLERPVVRFDLAVDQINLDRYRPPQPTEPPAAGHEDVLSKLSNEQLRSLGWNIRGDVRVGKITLNGDRTNNFVAKLEWNP